MLMRVDLAHGRGADADRDGAAADERREPLPLERGQGLRVADARNPAGVGLHDHGRGDDRTARGRHADLVDADDADRAVAPVVVLESKRRDSRLGGLELDLRGLGMRMTIGASGYPAGISGDCPGIPERLPWRPAVGMVVFTDG